MRGLALLSVVVVMLAPGCGSKNGGSEAKAPRSDQVAATGPSTGSAGVAAAPAPTPGNLCASEGTGKPKKQCVSGLSKLNSGKAANPAAACKGLSKKKTKGVRGKSPYAVCVTAAAKLMAASNGKSQGSADNSSGDGTSTDDQSAGDESSAGSSSDSGLTCQDANGKAVAPDSPDVESCDDPSPGDSSDGG